MKTVYVIYAYIQNRLWESKLKYLIDEHIYVLSGKEYDYDGDKRSFLYAWTTKEEYLNDFKYFRKNAIGNIYEIEKMKMDKSEYSNFKDKYENERLLYRQIPANDNEFYGTNDYINTLCTNNEFVCAVDEGNVYLYDYFSEIIKVEYCIFNKKYVNALDCLGYCDEFNVVKYEIDTLPDRYHDMYSDRYELSEFNNSFNLTGFGNHRIDLYANKFAIFVNLFYEMIEGYHKNEEIRMVREDD